MATLQQEWEEEVRLHQLNVRRQRSEMMQDIERIEAEYDAKVATLGGKGIRVLQSHMSILAYVNLSISWKRKTSRKLILFQRMRDCSLNLK